MSEQTPENQPFEDEAAQATPEAMAAQKIEQQDAEILKLKDAYLRAMAETENVRSRAKRDLEDSNKYAATKFARDMVGLAENIQRASASITADARAKNDVLKQVGDGIDMTLSEMLGVFERHGIKRINPEGQKFDHNLHQAVGQLESPNAEPGSVVQVLQAGYLMHDRLLKPAMVMVAASAKPNNDNAA